MAASIPGAIPQSDLIDVTTRAALDEKKKLQKHFGRTDIFFFLICVFSFPEDFVGKNRADSSQIMPHVWLN